MENYELRFASIEDADLIYSFSSLPDFKVNDKIVFYEKKEIKEWLENIWDNKFALLFVNKKIAGFCFYKLMSYHWALIDNFFIKKEYRRDGYGTKLQEFVENNLKESGIFYISRTTRANNNLMHAFLNKTGYSNRGDYTWFDKFL